MLPIERIIFDTQFRWGGRSSLGIDSSGLVSIVYLINEIIVWRDSNFTEKYFCEINKDEIRRGDIIFFSDHTGIYIGEDKFIHSYGAKSGVVINSLDPLDDEYRESLASSVIKIGRCNKFPTI